MQPGTVVASDSFTQLLLPKIPASVTDLQGESETFQGYSAFLRFRADNVAIDSIIATGFQPMAQPYPRLDVNLQTPPTFNPPWRPKSLKQAECYRMDVVNSSTHDGTHYLVVDRAAGIVYFVGFGA